MPTIDEIKKFVGEEGISPSEVFGRDSLIDDPIVKGYVDEERKIASSGEYAHRKRTDDKFDEKKKEWDDEKKKLEDENKGLKTESAKVKAADLFSKKAKERKLDDKQIKFISQKQGDFTPQNVDELEKEVDASMDSMLEEFKNTARIFGHKTEEKKEGTKGGGEPGESGSGEDNELIPD